MPGIGPLPAKIAAMHLSMTIARWALVGLGGLALVGCDEEGSSEPTGRDLRADEIDARCEYLVRCGFYPDRDQCITSEGPDTGLLQALGAEAFGRVEYDYEAVEAYIDTLRGLSCDDTLSNAQLIADARAAAFSGKIEIGGDCFADLECEGEAVCDRNACNPGQLCCTGSCVAITTLAIGDSCPLTTDGPRITSFCGDDAYCAPPPDDGGGMPAAAGTCTLRGTNGDPCDYVDACGDGQRCDTGGSNTCYRLSGSGEMCNPMLQRGSCLGINETCDPGSSTCQVAPGPGQACPDGRCAGYAFCDDMGMCVGRPGLGESCDVGPCLGDLFCQDNVCSRNDVINVCIEGEPPPPPMDGG
jgi:hypothetical protein